MRVGSRAEENVVTTSREPRHLILVLGYTCANDVSARELADEVGWIAVVPRQDICNLLPLGPCLVTRDEIPNPNSLAIRTVLNGQVMQDWNTNDMIFDIPTLIEFLSGSTVLLPGTVILTGTPHGVGGAASRLYSFNLVIRLPSKSKASAN